MKLVIDANVIIAMLIKPGKPTDLFFRDELVVYAPELLLKELENNRKTIIQKSAFTSIEIDLLFRLLKDKILFVPEAVFLAFRKEAERICPDPKDITYFALALYLKCPIWTNEKKEKKLQNQTKVKIYATHELIALFS
ncbi:MAG TPA: PIN domain-containing protein [Candidatus Nanoarchaeia archaeon]|nr:PIN domain-containing protein [Candidatus Nanoarchaeia archaeon]